MKIKPIGYVIRISAKEKSCGLLCVIHSLDREGKFNVAEFAELSSTFPNQDFNIPSDRPFSFQEELHINARASDLVPKKVDDINTWIKSKMEEAYGKGIKINIEVIKG